MLRKLVSVPPSQRWLTYGMLQRFACCSVAARAWRLVPTKTTSPPSATSRVRNFFARRIPLTVSFRSIMWMKFRLPKM